MAHGVGTSHMAGVLPLKTGQLSMDKCQLWISTADLGWHHPRELGP